MTFASPLSAGPARMLWLLGAMAAGPLPAVHTFHMHAPRHLPKVPIQLVTASRVHISMIGTAPLVEGLVTLFKVEGFQCGEAHVRREFVPFAQQFAGLEMGDCASIGYAKPTSARTISVPVVGTIRVALYVS